MITDELIAALKQTDRAEGLIATAALRERHGVDGFRQICSEINLRDMPPDEVPEFLSSGEYLIKTGEPLPMLVDKLLPDKSLVLLAGKPKLGKSYIALQIMEDVEQGRAVFGKYHLHRRGAVCYLGMEDGDSEISRRLRHRGHFNGEDRQLGVFSQRLLLSTPEGVDILRSMITKFTARFSAPVLVVIDTARESLGIKDSNDSVQVTDALRPLRDFARDVCTVLLVAHNRKQAAENPGDEIAGSGAFASSCDGWLSGVHGENMPNGNRRMQFSINGRGDMRGGFIVEMDTHSLEIRALTDDELCEEQEVKIAAKRGEKYDRILSAIESFSDRAATISQIAAKLGLGHEATRTQVLAAVQDGFIAETGETLKPLGGGRPAPTYRVIQ